MTTTDLLVDKVYILDKEVASVKKDQEIQNKATVKLEETIDRIQILTESMHRLISIHDEKIAYNSKINENHILQSESQRDEMSRDIKELNARLTKETSDLSDKMEAMERRLSDKIDSLTKKDEKDENAFTKLSSVVNNWRWLVVGLAFILGTIAGEHSIVTSIIKWFAL